MAMYRGAICRGYNISVHDVFVNTNIEKNFLCGYTFIENPAEMQD